jgi:glycosyltransferase involved in cell wall biosynthesis
VREVVRSPEQGIAMGRAGRHVVVEEFSAQAMVRQMEDLYCRLLRRRGVVGADQGTQLAQPVQG